MTWFKSELFSWYYGHEPFGSMTTVNFLDSWTNTHKVRSHTMESVSHRYSSNLNIITELKYEVLLAVTMNSMVFWEEHHSDWKAGMFWHLTNPDASIIKQQVYHNQNTWCHISGDSTVQKTWIESLRPCKDSQVQPEFPNYKARKNYSWHLTIYVIVLSVFSERRSSMALWDEFTVIVYFCMKHFYTLDHNLNFPVTIFLSDFSTKIL
jgi:hypothetical protein